MATQSSGKLLNTARVEFTPQEVIDEGAQYTLLWEAVGNGFRLFPALGSQARVGATNGFLRLSSSDTFTMREIVSFSNGRGVRTKFPVLRLIGSSLQFAFDSNDEPVSPVLSATDDWSIRSNIPFTGIAVVSYETTCDNYYLDIHSDVNQELLFKGQLYAYYKGTTATFDLRYATSEDDTPEFELLRVTSEYVVDKTGPWEKPPDYPDNTSYSSGGITDEPSKRGVVVERVHEVWFIDVQGRTRNEMTNRKPFKPFDDRPNFRQLRVFTPEFKLTKNRPPDEFLRTILDFDDSEILSALTTRYPGVEIDSFR